MALSPTSSHGGGTFNGGVITEALDIQGGASSPYLDLQTPGLTSNLTLLATQDSGHGQHVTLASAGGGTLIAAGGSAQPGDTAAFLSGNPGQTADIVAITNSSAAEQCGFNKNGYFYTKRHTAPADAELAAGQLMLWFDQTNGAGKLMVKAKTADGTVVAASVALA